MNKIFQGYFQLIVCDILHIEDCGFTCGAWGYRLKRVRSAPLTMFDLIVVSSRLSRLVAHFQIFRLFMKGKFDAYVLWPLSQRVQNWTKDRSTARDFTDLRGYVAKESNWFMLRAKLVLVDYLWNHRQSILAEQLCSWLFHKKWLFINLSYTVWTAESFLRRFCLGAH